MEFILKLLRPLASLIFKAISIYQKKYHRLPEWYFFAFERLTLLSAFELLVTKTTDQGEEIFLIKRPGNDPVWPNLWHFPGTILRFYDEKETIFKRLAEELDVEKLPMAPQLLETMVQSNERGRHLHVFYKLEVPAATEYSTGQFFPLNNLPADAIAYQVEQIHKLI